MVYIINLSVFAISLCFGMGTTITGLVIRNRIIQVCGLIAGIGGFFGALHFLGHTQLYVMAVVFGYNLEYFIQIYTRIDILRTHHPVILLIINR